MEMPQLVVPESRYRDSFLRAERDTWEEGRTFFREWTVTEATFDRMLTRMEERSRGIGLPPGHVADTMLWLVRGDDFLGQIGIRHSLTGFLREVGGHIGYAVAPAERCKGYGTLMLRLALPHSLALGINPALVTCAETNIGSRKIIEANGGIYEGAHDPGDGSPKILRFWVPTDQS